jgi:hypothetical protein
MAPPAALLALRKGVGYSPRLAPCIRGHLVRNAAHEGFCIRLLGQTPPTAAAHLPARRRGLPRHARAYILGVSVPVRAIQPAGSSVKPIHSAFAVGLFLSLVMSSSASAQRISCESRDYNQNYCSTGSRITGAWLIYQRSVSPCVQGRTWGWNDRGIWVNSGCAGEFGYQGSRPSGNTVSCESRDYRQNYCGAGVRISRAWIVEQRSQSPCIQGRSWGYDGGGIWVNNGCSAVFAVQGGGGPPAPPVCNNVRCESRNYKYNFCSVGSGIRRARMINQLSESPCIEGQTWGSQGNGIWVNSGCGGVFAFDRR